MNSLHQRWLALTPAMRGVLIGAAIGIVFGFFFGGIGIAARGGAFGVNGPMLFGLIGAYVGYRLQRNKIDPRSRQTGVPHEH